MLFYIFCFILLVVIFYLYKKTKWFKNFIDTNSPICAVMLSLVTLFLVFATWNLATSTKKMASSSEAQIGILETQSGSLDKQLKQLKKNVGIQEKSFDFAIRPYISIRLMNFGVTHTKKDTFIGGDIFYRNYGKIPASNIKTKFYITTKEDGIHNRSLKDYAQQEWGGYKKVSFLSPEEFDIVSRRLSLAQSASIYYINAIVTYEGLVEKRTYWTFFKKVIRIENIAGPNVSIIEIDSEGKWDNNRDFQEPELETPDFSIYKAKKLK